LTEPTSTLRPKQSAFWKRFRSNWTAWVSLWLFTFLLAISAGATLVANDRPLVMSYKDKIYFPAVVKYLPHEFGWDGFVVDYFSKEPEIEKSGWLVWPPIARKPYEPNLDFDKLPAPPNSISIVGKSESYEGKELVHHLGTDYGGRDLFTRLLYGCRTSLLMAIAITFLSMILGVSLGSVMGYIGGKFDLLIGRLLETLGYFPVIFMIIILVAFMEEPSMTAICIIFAVLGISPFAFYMRGQVLSVRKLTFVEAAVALGQTHHRIMWKHIMPNALGPILVLVPFTISSNISFLAIIDFLGFGVQPPTASLGAILRSGYDDVANRSWLVAYSSIVLVTILLLVNFIGDGVRDGMDPHATISKRSYNRWVASLKGAKG
jgi:microcin C transport system permease protein